MINIIFSKNKKQPESCFLFWNILSFNQCIDNAKAKNNFPEVGKIILLLLLATHSQVKDILNGMLEPIKSAGGTPPPIPNYLINNTEYIIFNSLFFGLLLFIFIGMFYIKNKFPKKLIRI